MAKKKKKAYKKRKQKKNAGAYKADPPVRSSAIDKAAGFGKPEPEDITGDLPMS